MKKRLLLSLSFFFSFLSLPTASAGRYIYTPYRDIFYAPPVAQPASTVVMIRGRVSVCVLGKSFYFARYIFAASAPSGPDTFRGFDILCPWNERKSWRRSSAGLCIGGACNGVTLLLTLKAAFGIINSRLLLKLGGKFSYNHHRYMRRKAYIFITYTNINKRYLYTF